MFGRYLIFAALVWPAVSCAQQNIRQVDFSNFDYPLRGALLGYSKLQWLSTGADYPMQSPVHLVSGKDLHEESSFVVDGKRYAHYSGFVLVSVKYGDLTGDGKDEAVVDLHYQTGGTQQTDYVYVFTLKNDKPQLLDYCHTGDRAHSGLYQLYVTQRSLMFELYDPQAAIGDCCSTAVVATRFVWRGKRFQISGPVRRRSLRPPEQVTLRNADGNP